MEIIAIALCLICSVNTDVHVGYEHSSYTLTEVDGYVQLCVNSTSTGISADFSVMLKTNNTGTLIQLSTADRGRGLSSLSRANKYFG